MNRAAVLRSLAFTGTSLIALSSPLDAQAGTSNAPQSPPDTSSIVSPVVPVTPDESDSDDVDRGTRAAAAANKDIIVTGTLLRGIAPAGSSVLSLGRAQIQSTGANTTNQILATIPQITNYFNTVPTVSAGSNNAVQINRPNIHNLPGGGVQSGSGTLILVDGHRVVGAGVNQDAPDPDIVPPGIIDRVEVITDGGSSLYGADAVGGVVNFITRKRFNGFQTDTRYGFADNYRSVDTNATIGKDWNTGSIYVSYNYEHHDAIYGRDRDYARNIEFTTGLLSSLQCSPGNISVGGRNYALPTLTLGSGNRCDTSDDSTIFPRETRHSVFGGITQDLSSAIKFEFRTFYTHRFNDGNQGPYRAAVNVSPTNPFYENLVGTADANATQSVQFDFSPVYGNASTRQTTTLDEYGVTPSLTADLGHGWEIRTMFNYGRSHTTYANDGVNQALLQQYANGLTPDTAIDPYDIAATPNQQLLSAITNYRTAGVATSELYNGRAIIDGRLFRLPAGDVKIAAGAEYIGDNYSTRSGSTVRGALNTSVKLTSYSRHTKAVFGEVQIPIFGPDNATTLLRLLNVSGSVRYDKYSDFGSTTNPKVGVTYKPVEWFTLRGSYGKSFNAPTPVDQLASLSNTVLAENFFTVAPIAGPPAPAGSYAIALLGSTPNLQPQKADQYSIGADLDVPFVPGLRANINYYHIKYKGELGQAPVFDARQLFAYYQNFVTLNPTQAQVIAFCNSAGAAQAANCSSLIGAGAPKVYELLDFRRANLGNTLLSGLDFSASYARQTDFGAIDANFSGNYQLMRRTQAADGAVFANDLATLIPRLTFTTGFGATIGKLRAQAKLNHTSGYAVTRSAVLPQDHVKAFNTVDLFFRYDLNGQGILKDFALTANISNLLDTDPPLYRQNGVLPGQVAGGYDAANSSTLGRYVQIGVSKKF